MTSRWAVQAEFKRVSEQLQSTVKEILATKADKRCGARRRDNRVSPRVTTASLRVCPSLLTWRV
jgi:hypothetical protein